ncbi:MAG: methyltransferase domain-containing protein [Aggregatilineales bacterium]
MGDNKKIIPDLLIRALLGKLQEKNLLDTPGVEAAFRAVPRHLFLPDVSIQDAYEDRAIPIKRDAGGLVISSASQPTMMAIMLQQLQLKPGENVLEIGTATGYNAAIMQHIVGEQGHVTSIELDKDLADQARKNLQSAGYEGVRVVQADGVRGYAQRAAYDVIIATVGIHDVPPAWLSQLKQGARLVVPIWLDGVQVSALFHKTPDGSWLSEQNNPCAFVYLRGDSATSVQQLRVGTAGLQLLADNVRRLDPISLHTLLSDDHSVSNLSNRLSESDYWYGFQLYIMLNTPDKYTFAIYAVLSESRAYGLEGRGIALFSPAGAVFAPYQDRGVLQSYAGSDATLLMQSMFDDWEAAGRPGVPQLRLQLIPMTDTAPEIESGRLFRRIDHYLHVWMDTVDDND